MIRASRSAALMRARAHGLFLRSAAATVPCDLDGGERRWMGSFHGIKKDPWYKESLRNAVSDLRQELNLEEHPQSPPVPISPEEPSNVMTEDLEAMGAVDGETPSNTLQTIQELASRQDNWAFVDDVTRIFTLLDQLVQQRQEEMSEHSRQRALDTELLHQIIAKWKACWKKDRLSEEEIEILLKPWDLLDKLDDYQKSLSSDYVLVSAPDTTIYNNILSVASEWKGSEAEDHHIALFVQSVVDQMKIQQQALPDTRTHNLLIKSWARAGNLQKVLDLFPALTIEGETDVNVHGDTLQAITTAFQNQTEMLSGLEKYLATSSIPSNGGEQVGRRVHDNNNVAQTIQQWMEVPKGVDKCFRYLDRCVLSDSGPSMAYLPKEVFFELLMEWKKYWIRKSTYLTPRSIVDKVLLYHDRPNNGWRADTRIFNFLIAALRISDEKDLPRALDWGKHLLDRMTGKADDDGPLPDSNTYKALIQLQTKAGDMQGALDLVVSLRDQNDNMAGEPKIELSPESFDALLDACIQLEGDNRNLGNLAEGILELMRQLGDAGRLSAEATEPRAKRRLSGKAVRCWEKSGHPNAAERIQAILADLGGEDTCTGSDNADACIDVTEMDTSAMKHALIQALAKAGKAREAQEHLQDICDAYEMGQHELEPNTATFNAVLNAWAQKGAAREAEAVMNKMTQCCRSGVYKQVQPNAFSFNCTIHAWAKSNHPKSSERALELLQEMERQSSQEPDSFSLRPTARTYTSVINALAKNGKAQMAEEMLLKMHRAADKGNSLLMPNWLTYNAVIDAWARSKMDNSGAKAERLLACMYEFHREGFKDILPDVVTYNSVLFAWGNSKSPRAGLEADRLVGEMLEAHKTDNHTEQLKPDGGTYCYVIYAWSKSGNMKRAEDRLKSQCDNFLRGDINIAPDIRSLNFILDAWAESGLEDAGDNAARLLKEFSQQSKSGPIGMMQPNAISYAAVIKAHSRSNSPESGKKAEDTLGEMLQVGLRPNIQCYGSVMHAHSRQGNFSRVETLLNEMTDECTKGQVKSELPTTRAIEPDTQCFNMLLMAYCNSRDSDAGPKADALLKRMENFHQQGTLSRAKPDRFSIQAAIWCWRQCSNEHPSANERIASLTKRLQSFKGDKARGKRRV
ncbi:Pentatricopeptide repeat-containing protein [Seminavis robusta]|uniref:Pentatricopeptide repeat-containing protein n=1 Tax=Seminavis robusta TaxID=568900 RepID=A0A9N8HY03_9STRA|nr:Pentatricopeptide repeat-containing protein [Seminavis robusta]|eukprot:Sro2357_g324590.1 Pentatricopeptide repeat-containing protein (1139) ;mRNA; r:3893-7309